VYKIFFLGYKESEETRNHKMMKLSMMNLTNLVQRINILV